MLTMGRVLSLYWLVMLVVQGVKKRLFSAVPVLLESLLAITMMMLVFNVLVSITFAQKLHTYLVHVNILAVLLATAPCQNGDVRLAGSSDPLQGRVEVCVNETWGTICEDFWDTNDTSVVCRQLGFSAEGMCYSFITNCKSDTSQLYVM